MSNSGEQTVELALEGMTCAACATRIEKTLNRLEGVQANVNYATETAQIRFEPRKADVAALIGAVRKAGYEAHIHDTAKPVDHSAENRAVCRAASAEPCSPPPANSSVAASTTTAPARPAPSSRAVCRRGW